ncbi:MAG: amidophosphoribosyltransferase [Culicoidibacterales bacterium]
MFGELHEECGVFAVYNHPQASRLAYYGLHSLQHRGQEGTGIISGDGAELNLHKGEGLVSEIYDDESLATLTGTNAIGHVRYATAGGAGYNNVQPLLFQRFTGSDLGIAHNGNIVNAHELKCHLEQQGSIFQATSDTEILAHLLFRKQGTMVERLCESLQLLEGAFAFVILHGDTLYVARDRHGLRPLSIGMLNGAYIFASETCALDIVGATFIRDVLPGEVITVNKHGLTSTAYAQNTTHAMCSMEYIYFSRPDSDIEGINVHRARRNTGHILAKEAAVDADIVIGVPDSSISAAIGYSEVSGIPYEIGLVKNRYIGRTFIQPTQELREQGVKMKLSAVRSIVAGKRIVMIDDSIVRGTTSKRIVRMLKEAGATEVHVRIAAPAIKYPCFYGVDMSTFDELISSRLDEQQLAEYIEADSLAFISLPGLLRGIGRSGSLGKNCGQCTACFNGDFPTNLYESYDAANREKK